MKDASKKDNLNATVRRPDAPRSRRLDEDPDRHLIRLQLAKPPCERTHFLRIALTNGGSCI